jgi:pyrroloquinoline quinone (PQQ) biosynthesis protein C
MTPYQLLVEHTADERAALHHLPVLTDLAEGRYTLDSYRAFLTNAFHHVRHTVPLMMACGARLQDRDRLSWLQPALVEYIREEAGHEQWILNDLATCGADPARVRASVPSLDVELLVAFVYDFIARRNPVGFFGMVYVLEGTSTALATSAADLVQSRLGLPDRAFSYLRSHGELDKEHISFFADLIDQISDPADLDDIVHVARRVFHLYGQVLDSVPRGTPQQAAARTRNGAHRSQQDVA